MHLRTSSIRKRLSTLRDGARSAFLSVPKAASEGAWAVAGGVLLALRQLYPVYKPILEAALGRRRRGRARKRKSPRLIGGQGEPLYTPPSGCPCPLPRFQDELDRARGRELSGDVTPFRPSVRTAASIRAGYDRLEHALTPADSLAALSVLNAATSDALVELWAHILPTKHEEGTAPIGAAPSQPKTPERTKP